MENLPDAQNIFQTKPPEKRAEGDLIPENFPSRVQLSDITNMQQRSLRRSTTFSPEVRDFIQKMQKENTMLRSLLDERNKIIEMSAVEIQKLRINLQKMCSQNMQLAKANSQIQMELNLRKDRLKEQQHEQGCTIAMLRAKNLELEEKLKKQTQHIVTEICEEVRVTKSQQANPPMKASNLSRRCQSQNPSSVGLSTVDQPVVVTEKIGNKRLRRSSVLKPEQTEPTDNPEPSLSDKVICEDFPSPIDFSSNIPHGERKPEKGKRASNLIPQNRLQEKPIDAQKRKQPRRSDVLEFEQSMPTEALLVTENAEIPYRSNSLGPPTSSNVNGDNEGGIEEKEENIVPQRETQVERRRSVRRAVEKIASYKEKPINLKERRSQ